MDESKDNHTYRLKHIALIGIFTSSFMTTPIPFSVIYGVPFGFGSGFIYLPTVICGWEYFPKHKGLVTALTLSGNGIGAFLFGFVSLEIVNPENQAPELEVLGGKIFDPSMKQSDRAPMMIRLNGSIWACILLIVIILVSKPEKEKDNDDEYALNQ